MPDHQVFARALAAILHDVAALLDDMTDRTCDPAWSVIASELDQIAVRLREIAAGRAARVTRPLGNN